MALDSDKEQLDELKVWWKENGRVAIAGLVLGLGGVFGWTTWQNYTTQQAENASRLYEETVNWAAAKNFQRVNELSEQLLREYPKSGYAPLTALIRAQSAVSQDNADEARGYLRWVMDNAQNTHLKAVANLRLARLTAEKREHDAALALLNTTPAGELSVLYDELRGDIHVAAGQTEDALRHYSSALDSERVSPASRSRIEMKRADLGLRESTATSGN